MKILVTGGAGYIGSTLVPKLLEDGHHVTVVDNFRYGIQSLNAVCHYPRFDVYKADVRDIGFVKSLLQGVDAVIPLAALVGAPLCNQFSSEASSVNKAAIFDMLKLLSSDQYVLMPTTNSAYGGGLSGVVCDEESPLNPLSQYAKEKVEVESILMEHKNAVSFRLATVFGMSPRLRTDLLVNDFVLRAWRDGFVVMYEPHFKRNYIHVRDVASAFVHCLDNLEYMRGHIFNVGLSAANLSKMELALKVKEHFENFEIIVADNFSDPDQRNYVVSNQKLEHTGWKPAVDLDAGISELAKGYAMMRKFQDGNI